VSWWMEPENQKLKTKMLKKLKKYLHLLDGEIKFNKFKWNKIKGSVLGQCI